MATALWMAASAVGQAQAVVTAQNDNSRLGANLSETTLTTSNVSVSQFGKVFTRTVDGYIFAQPLYVPNVSIPGNGIHNVVYVATMNDSVYAFDADDATAAAPLWQRSLGTAVPATTAYLPQDETGSIAPTNGILSTPVIDPSTGSLYAVALVLVGNSPTYQLHALNITTGAERPGSPVTIQATAMGSGPDSQGGVITFNAARQNQRTGLLLLNGRIYFGFASYGDTDPYHGWILGYDANTLQQTAVLNLTPGGEGGVWQAGGGLSADASGFIYACVGNGVWDGTFNFGESCVKLDPSKGLSVADYFTPYNYNQLDAADQDLGSGRPLLIPGTNLMVTGGKQGLMYVLNENSLGQLSFNDTGAVQQFNAGGRIFSALAYWNNPASPLLYVWASSDVLRAYRFNGGVFDTNPVSSSSIVNIYGAASGLTVSSNGGTAGSGIVWAFSPTSNGNPGLSPVPGTLYALDASNLSNELWDSGQNAARDSAGNLAKFAAPTVANGKVYIPTFSNQLVVYGILPSGPLTVSPGAITLDGSQIQKFTSNQPVTWTINPTLGSIAPDGTYTAPATVSAEQTVTVTAVSIADNTKSVAATVTLRPVSVNAIPATASLFASETRLFSAQVAGSNNSTVTWTINPGSAGSIAASGLYTAPATIASQQIVTITATSVADNTKFGTATVTLNPPAPPIITQQPQNATVTSGQNANFAVTATGGSLTYQWRSMAPGAGSFSNISGATSNTYVTPATTLAGNGTQYQCVVSNSLGTVPSTAATLTVLTAGTSFVTSETLGTLRNNYTGWVGMAVTVGPASLVVSTVGRMYAPGNTGTHTVKIVDALTGADVVGGTASISMVGGTPGTFVYGLLANQVTLNANSAYYVLSQEISGGDQWYDDDTVVQTTANAVLNAPAYGTTPYAAVPGLGPGQTYVPVDFKYVSIGVLPSSAVLSASQTQQFAVTVVSLGSNAVTWSLTPSVGSISLGGLYTAPATIASQQNVTVTATSVVDPTKSAGATVTLTPVVVSVSPATANLFNSQTQQFAATVTGSSNTGVSWSITPSNSGSISAAGLYTAPASITSQQTVTVTATSLADGTKSGTASVTLNVPGLPSITQQPQSVTVIAGQTADFSVTASGIGLIYQWQSKPPGATTFGNIAGATTNAYTTPVTTQANDGTQFRCVVTNSQGSVPSNAAVLTVVAPGAHFVTSSTLGHIRNNFTGWVGMSMTVGPAPLVITTLGRMVAPGNTGTHVVKIIDAATGMDLAGAAVSVKTAGSTPGTFSYSALQNPITLAANTDYLILSQETLDGDQWYDSDTTVQTINVALLTGPVYGTSGAYNAMGLGGHMFVPVDFSTPVSVSLSDNPHSCRWGNPAVYRNGTGQ